MKESVSVHHPIIWTGLKNITPMFLSIKMMFHFFFNEQKGFRGKNQPDYNGIRYLIQCLQFWNIRKEQLIASSKSRHSLMELCPILRFPLIIFSTLLITRQNLLNSEELLRNIFRLNSKKDLYFST